MARWASHLRLSALLFACAVTPATTASCSQTHKLTLQLPRPIQPEYAGFVVPTSDFASGAPKFGDECLNVQVQGGGVGFDPLQELKDGRADLAIAEGAYVAQKIQAGEQLTIVAGFYQRNGSVWVATQKYSTLKNLAFKKVGVWCCGYGLPFEAMVKAAHSVTVESTIEYKEQTYVNWTSGNFAGRYDLVTAMLYDELARPLQERRNSSSLRKSSETFVLDPANYGITSVHNVLVVKTSQLVSMRAKIVSFLKVVIKAWHFCKANEVSCASAFSPYGIATPHHLWQMREVNQFIFPSPSGHGLGVLSLQRWDAMNTWMVASGALTTSVGSSMINNSMVLEAGALNDISTWMPMTEGSLSFCVQNAVGYEAYRLCVGNEHTMCPAGQEPSGFNDYECKLCEPGRFASSSSRMNTCQVCPSGRYATSYGKSECDLCEPGRFWTSGPIKNASMTKCPSCPAGRFSNEYGAKDCRNCTVGTFSAVEGAKHCIRCPFGHFMDVMGAAVCKRCKEGMATPYLGALSQSDCVCPQDTYLSQKTADCLPCPEGMVCSVNSKESNLRALAKDPNATLSATASGTYPRLAAGYWSASSDPFSVSLCWHDSSCPGDLPDRCGKNMRGRACGQCEAGYYKDGLECYPCTGTDESAFNFPLLQVIFGPIIVVILYWAFRDQRENWTSWWNELTNVTFSLFVHYQIVGLLVFTFIQWPAKLSSMLMPWTYLVDIVAMLRLSCSEYADFRHSLLVKETAPALVLAIFVITYVICWIIGKAFGLCKGKQDDKLEEGQVGVGQKLLDFFPLKVDILFNLYCAIFHAFYVSICFISLQLYMCYEHPTTDWSLLFAPQVTCYSSDEWKGMITESIFALLAYIVAPIVGFSYVVVQAPKQFHKKGFHTRWKFLFIKFRPDTFWWMIFHMLRTLALCLMLVFSQEGSRQVYYAFSFLLFYAALLAICFPWRHRSANLFDLLVTSLLLFFCALGASYARRHHWLDESLANFSAVMTFSPLVVLPVLLGMVFWRKFVPSTLKARTAKKRELAAECRKTFEKFVGLEKAASQAFVLGLSGQDRDVLRIACSTIVAELSGSQPGSAGLCWRIVHQEHKLGARQWSPASAAPSEEPAGSAS